MVEHRIWGITLVDEDTQQMLGIISKLLMIRWQEAKS